MQGSSERSKQCLSRACSECGVPASISLESIWLEGSPSIAYIQNTMDGTPCFSHTLCSERGRDKAWGGIARLAVGEILPCDVETGAFGWVDGVGFLFTKALWESLLHRHIAMSR